jgi:hypothetical protein
MHFLLGWRTADTSEKLNLSHNEDLGNYYMQSGRQIN